jgi:hypothetical protein
MLSLRASTRSPAAPLVSASRASRVAAPAAVAAKVNKKKKSCALPPLAHAGRGPIALTWPPHIGRWSPGRGSGVPETVC